MDRPAAGKVRTKGRDRRATIDEGPRRSLPEERHAELVDEPADLQTTHLLSTTLPPKPMLRRVLPPSRLSPMVCKLPRPTPRELLEVVLQSEDEVLPTPSPDRSASEESPARP